MQNKMADGGAGRRPAKQVSFIYAGNLGSGLETALAFFGMAKLEGFDCRLVLSSKNSRRALVERLYPEAHFIDFLSPSGIAGEARALSGNAAFFTMVSPKLAPLFLAPNVKKAFYLHASLLNLFPSRGFRNYLSDKSMQLLHHLAISQSDMVVATQYSLAWQVRIRHGKEAIGLLHPPFSVLREGMFEASEKVELPFKPGSYFLEFGGIGHPDKGAQMLLKAVDGTSFPTVLAGKAKLPPCGKNVFHINRWLSDGEVHFLVKNAKCVVLPYLSASQFSGCMALAFRLGVPVLAPFCPAFEGWVEEGKTGWFFHQGDWNSMRGKMEGISSGKLGFAPSAIRAKEHEMESRARSELCAVLEKLSSP